MLLSTGCGGGGRAKPKDLPPLYPCTLTFIQEGAPLAKADIILHSDSKWAVTGQTNENGQVKLTTNGYYDGVPEGTYKITVRRIIVVMDAKNENPVKQTDIIPNEFKMAANTTLEIAIGKKENDKTYDLGKAVRINVPLDTVSPRGFSDPNRDVN
jgi:hypothetical protein